MAVKKIKCVFNSINGENTGSWCRSGKSASTKKVGLLVKKNCKDGTFYVDGNDSGNSYYRLLNPKDYKLPDQKMYAYINKSFIKSMEEVKSAKKTTKEEILNPEEHISVGGHRPVFCGNKTFQAIRRVAQFLHNGQNFVFIIHG